MKRMLIIATIACALMFTGNAFAQEATAIVDGVQAGAMSQNNLSITSEAANLNDGRGFVIPGEINFPGTPGYFGEATPGHRFIPLTKLFMYTTAWDANSAREMLKGQTGQKDVQIRDLVATKGTAPADVVYCSIVCPDKAIVGGIQQVSIGTVAATNRKSISADVLAKAIVAASERGANYIQFMAEGVNREVDASGWGIGFNATTASMHSDNDKSSVATGGMGYSRGWAGYIDYPWLQFTFLKVDTLPAL
jgi:hypothetical protein